MGYTSRYRGLSLSLLLLLSIASTKINAIRGVDPTKEAHYAAKPFRCLDGSGSGVLNDEYCDCKDNSDEPGTSACSGGSFYCVNKGYEAMVVPSSRVNDGICDCCDGSDEWKEAQCSDTCVQVAREVYKEQIDKLEIMKKGIEEKLKLEEEGEKAKVRVLSSKSETEAKLKEAETRVQEWKAKVAVLDEQASSKENEAGMQENVAGHEQTADEADIESHSKEEAADEETEDEEKFPYPKEYAAPSAGNDEGEGEEKFPYPKEYAAPDASEPTDDDGDDDEGEEKFPYPKEYAAPSGGGEDGQKLAGDAQGEGDDGIRQPDAREEDNEDQEQHTSQTPLKQSTELEVAKKELRMAESEVRQLKKEAEDSTKALDDTGSLSAFIPLHHKCFEKEVRQYTYEVCLFKDAYQKEGSSRTRLGNYVSFDKETLTIEYKNGQTCWNGPARSIKVTLECGAENQLGHVDEPSKCVYATVLKTPAACDPVKVKELEQIVGSLGNR